MAKLSSDFGNLSAIQSDTPKFEAQLVMMPHLNVILHHELRSACSIQRGNDKVAISEAMYLRLWMQLVSSQLVAIIAQVALDKGVQKPYQPLSKA